MPKRTLSLVASGVVTLAFMAAFIGLGRWQWTTAFAHQQQLSADVSKTAQPLSRVSTAEQWLPRASIGALTTAVGQFDFAHSFRTSPRPTAAGHLPWTVVPLKLRDGSVLAVVIGAESRSLRQPKAATAATVVGRLQPSEDSPAVGLWQPSKPELTTDGLTDRWPYPVVRDGYLVATQNAGLQAALATPRFISAPTGSIGWRNIAYAFQWWVFAFFAMFVWWRHVMESRNDASAE